MTDQPTNETPAPDDVVQVKPTAANIKHNGVLYTVADVIEAPFKEVAHLVKAGVATVEKVLGVSDGDDKKKSTTSKASAQKSQAPAKGADSTQSAGASGNAQSGASK